MIFGGTTESELGFVILERRGFYDMPSRGGASFYDWGGEIEPLVTADDIFFSGINFELDVLFDPRIKPSGNIRDSINTLISKGVFTLDLGQNSAPTTPFDKFDVVVDSVGEIGKRGTYSRVTLRLFCKEPKIHDLIIFPKTGISGYRFGDKVEGGPNDYYDFSNFRATVISVKKVNSYKRLKDSRKTVYKLSKGKLLDRVVEEIEVDTIIRDDNEELAHYYISAFKNLLGSPGIKTFYYNGVEYDCFYSDGFKTKRIDRGKSLRFAFRLNII